MDSDIWVLRCNPTQAGQVWAGVEAMLAPAIAESSGLFEPCDVHEKVTAPDAGSPFGWSLWIIAEKDQLLGAWTTKVEKYPRAKVMWIVFAGGSDMERWYEAALNETEKFALETGCDRLRCGGRRGWSRFGYRTLGYLHERLIR